MLYVPFAIRSTIASLIVELPYLREQQQPRLRRRRRCRHLTPRRRGSKLSNVAAAIGHDSPNIVSLDDDDTDVKGWKDLALIIT